jgi:hypothetical protein
VQPELWVAGEWMRKRLLSPALQSACGVRFGGNRCHVISQATLTTTHQPWTSTTV